MSEVTPPPVPPYQTTDYSAPPPSAEKYNVLAIVSLVAAFFISLVAVITGHIALSQIKRTGEKGRGLAIAGLILGYAGILAGLIVGVVLFITFVIIGVHADNALNNGDFSSTSLPFSEDSSSPSADDESTDAPLADGQSTAEACTILSSALADSTTALSNLGSLDTDPSAAVTALQNVSTSFDSGLAQITNPDVLEAGATTNSDLQLLISQIQAYVADPTTGTDDLVTSASTVQTDFTNIDSLCG